MPRVKRGTKRRAKRKKILDRASGYFLTKSKLYRSAKEAVERGLKFAYAGRRQKKRQYRSLWIVRIGAAAKLNGMSYNQFIHGLKKSGVELDRKILADLAVNDPIAFKSLAEQARGALGGGALLNNPQRLAFSSQPFCGVGGHLCLSIFTPGQPPSAGPGGRTGGVKSHMGSK